uniref:Uncharacterized protein n=1 Tax=viral metagenome TaxID=1070528 RepID=A0A6C0EAC2_9ZZZZ
MYNYMTFLYNLMIIINDFKMFNFLRNYTIDKTIKNMV